MKKNKLNQPIKKMLILVIILLLILCLYLKTKKDDNNYTLEINYINTNIQVLDNKIKSYTLEKKNEFLKIVKELEEKDITYDFKIDMESTEYDNIIYTHVLVYSYTGGAHYQREDKTFIYDKTENKFLNITDFLNSDNDFNKLSIIVRNIIYQYEENGKIQVEDKEWVNEGTKANLENYQHFYLNDLGLTILFPPYQVASWANGEIKITIPFKDIYHLLKEKYQRKLKVNEIDEPTLKITKDNLTQI